MYDAGSGLAGVSDTDLYDVVYSLAECEVGEVTLDVVLSLPQLAPSPQPNHQQGQKRWWHPSSWRGAPRETQEQVPSVWARNVERPPPQHYRVSPSYAEYSSDPFGAEPIMQSQSAPPSAYHGDQPFRATLITQQQCYIPPQPRQDPPNKRNKRNASPAISRHTPSSRSSPPSSSSLSSSSSSSLPTSAYVDVADQAPLDCYVYVPSSSSSPAAMDYYGSATVTPPAPTSASPVMAYERVYMDGPPATQGPFAPQVIMQSYGSPVVVAAPAPSPTRVRDWNEEFQRVRMIPQQSRAEPLYLLTKDFVSTATSIGKQIIMEAHTAEWLKSIKPRDAGGVAGGEKYIEEGIFFKFAKDSLGLYGGDEFAAKACNHELRGLNALLNCWVDGLHFPMLCLVDFLGFRLIASSILPITSKTLIYGSGDGGHTVANVSPEFSDKVAMAAGVLNLKAHSVGRTKREVLHLAGDVEGHLGTDGRFYILDTARVFPPDVPKPSVRCGHLYRLLRPELVKQNPVPLSSDAFSRWGLHHAAQHNSEVVHAVNKLTGDITPTFAALLRDSLATAPSTGRVALFDFWPNNVGTHMDGELLTQQMHRRGINMRYLSAIYTALTNSPTTSGDAAMRLVVTEMVARVAKTILRTHLRAAGTETDWWARAQRKATDLFTALFFGDALLPSVCSVLQTKFGLNLDQATVKRSLDREALFLRLQKMTGARFGHHAINKLTQQTADPSFTESDLVEFEPTVKSMRFVSMYEGFALLRKAEEEVPAGGGALLSDSPAQLSSEGELDKQRRLYLKAIEKFKECLSAMPDEPNAMMNWGYALMKLAQMEHRPDAASMLFDAAVAKYEDALSMRYSLNASVYTQAQAMYNMGLCFYHHAAFLRRLHAQQPPQHQSADAAGESRRDVVQLLARAGAQFAELRESGRMGHVSGNVLYLLACVHALANDERQCQECLEAALGAGQLNQPLLARHEFDALRDRVWFNPLLQRCTN